MRNLTRVLLATLSLVGVSCGSSNSKSEFIGTWSPSGTYTLTCGGDAQTTQLTDNITWATSSTSDLIQTSAGSSCVIHANVSGNTATASAGQSCTTSGTDDTGAAYQMTINLQNYTFVVAADGHTAQESLSANVSYISGGVTTPCTMVESAVSFTKQ